MATITLFAILPILYLTAIFSALILVIINQKVNNKNLKDILGDIEWEIIFFFIALYIVIGCLLEAGFKDFFIGIPFQTLNIFSLALMILLLISIISGFVANTPTALIFIPIIDLLIESYGFSPIPLLFGFIIGINIGGNIIPQGAACDLMTLKIAQDRGVQNLNYKRLFKMGFIFAVFHIFLSIMYLFILILFFG